MVFIAPHSTALLHDQLSLLRSPPLAPRALLQSYGQDGRLKEYADSAARGAEAEVASSGLQVGVIALDLLDQCMQAHGFQFQLHVQKKVRPRPARPGAVCLPRRPRGLQPTAWRFAAADPAAR